LPGGAREAGGRGHAHARRQPAVVRAVRGAGRRLPRVGAAPGGDRAGHRGGRRDLGLGAVRRRPGCDHRPRPFRRSSPGRRRHARAGLHGRGRARLSQEGSRRTMMTRLASRPFLPGGLMRTTLRAVALTLVATFAAGAFAADLPAFLPSEAIVAVGVEGLADHEDKARPFIDEWARLNLTQLMETAFAEEAE